MLQNTLWYTTQNPITVIWPEISVMSMFRNLHVNQKRLGYGTQEIQAGNGRVNRKPRMTALPRTDRTRVIRPETSRLPDHRNLKLGIKKYI